MRLRSIAMSTLWLGLFVTTVVALRAADEKSKAKPAETGKQAEAADPNIVKFASAPPAVQKTFKEETKGGKIESLGKFSTDKVSLFYKAIVGIGNADYEIAVHENGLLLEKIVQPDTVEIKPAECPPAVQKTVREEAKGAKIESVSKVTEGSQITFVVNVALQKLRYELLVADDGTLMQKVVDYESLVPEEKADAPKELPKPSAPKKK